MPHRIVICNATQWYYFLDYAAVSFALLSFKPNCCIEIARPSIYNIEMTIIYGVIHNEVGSHRYMQR